jgi:hypothetical protein
MALNWDTRDIKNHKEVCWVGEGEDRRLNPVTDALIWYTLALDIGDLSEANLNEFVFRMRTYDRLFRPLLSDANGDDRKLTYAEVKAHVGLSTNVSKVARNSWMKRMVENLSRETARLVKLESED